MRFDPRRRRFLQGIGTLGVGAGGFGSYALAVEPGMRMRVQRYAITPAGWPVDLRLRIAVIADLHASEPYMPQARVEEIVASTNALAPDVVALLGDYDSESAYVLRTPPPAEWAGALAQLSAPLGRYAVLGNHDWWHDREAQRRRAGPTRIGLALERAGVPVLENRALRLEKDDRPFWIAGLADQIALLRRHHREWHTGFDDLPGTLAQVTDDAPVILLAHEPDIFPSVPDRVALTLCGHTHGGQVRIFGYSPVVPSEYGNRYAYGHVVEGNRHLVVSGGLGTSRAPIRFGVPPEIVLIELGGGVAV